MKIRIRKQLAIAFLIILAIGIAVTLYALSNRQDIRQFAACPADSAVCSWDPVEGAIRYHYTITSNGGVVEEGDIDAPSTRINFTPIAGSTYTCAVYAVNNCGASGPSGEATQTCVISDSPTPIQPTPTPTNVPTVTPIVSETPTPSNSPTPLPSDVPTNTPTQPPQATNTPVPTTPPVTNTPTPTSVVIPTNTPTPGIPPTGSESFNIGIALGVLITIIGMAVFFAL